MTTATRLVVLADTTTYLYDTDNGVVETQWSLDPGYSYHAKTGIRGGHIVATRDDGTGFSIHRVATGETLFESPEPDDPTMIRMSRCGTAFVWVAGHAIWSYRIGDHEPTLHGSVPHKLIGLEVGGSTLAVMCKTDGESKIWGGNTSGSDWSSLLGRGNLDTRFSVGTDSQTGDRVTFLDRNRKQLVTVTAAAPPVGVSTIDITRCVVHIGAEHAIRCDDFFSSNGMDQVEIFDLDTGHTVWRGAIGIADRSDRRPLYDGRYLAFVPRRYSGLNGWVYDTRTNDAIAPLTTSSAMSDLSDGTLVAVGEPRNPIVTYIDLRNGDDIRTWALPKKQTTIHGVFVLTACPRFGDWCRKCKSRYETRVLLTSTYVGCLC